MRRAPWATSPGPTPSSKAAMAAVGLEGFHFGGVGLAAILAGFPGVPFFFSALVVVFSPGGGFHED